VTTRFEGGLERGERIQDRYEILEPLGAIGGEGRVYRARDHVLRREVALKVIKPGLYQELRTEFDAQMEAIGRLSGQPTVVQVFDHFVETIRDLPPTAVIVMEVGDGSLADVVSHRRGLTTTVSQALLEIAMAIRAMHDAGVSHNDVKPSNIIQFGAHWKLGDFGVAGVLAGTHDIRFMMDLTYASPERKASGEVRKAGDVFSFGLTIHEALVGELPKLRGRAYELAPSLDPRIASLVERCLHVAPRRRPSAAEVEDELRRWMLPGRRTRWRRSLLAAAAVTGVVTTGVYGVTRLTGDSRPEERSSTSSTTSTTGAGGGSSASILFTRVAGADRFATAAAVAESYPTGGTVFIATGIDYADALAGVPAAASRNAPILLVTDGSIPGPTETALGRLKPSKIVVLGGTAAVSTSTEDALQAMTEEPVTRIAGSNRFDTADAISDYAMEGGHAAVVYVATGESYADALAGGAASALQRGVLLLTGPDELSSTTADAIRRRDPERIVIVGGSAAVSAHVEEQLQEIAPVKRISGEDRFATAVALSKATFPRGTSKVFLATGESFIDALAGGPSAAKEEAPLLLIPGDCVPTVVRSELDRLGASDGVLLGGATAVSDRVALLAGCSA
jgi:putative cell wall-binding protein